MKKLCLAVVEIYLKIVAGFSQSAPAFNSSQSKNRKLKLEDVNLISSYYHQGGDNSAATGSPGTENQIDIANIIDVKFTEAPTSGKIFCNIPGASYCRNVYTSN